MMLQKNEGLVADGAVTADGLAFGTYLHGLFDSDAFTRAVVNGLRARKGLAPWETAFVMRSIKRGNLICWRKRCGSILILIKFIPSCSNIRSQYDNSGNGRGA